ncbi:EAL domain-containing protein [Syntrophothermus lipocalidus]|uniref:Diguanylate phosphodiesterase n=1 Tax=Syntrophothermus lipocalidus (strain DSM 12680 / TGB-C1) TaxID=643648 RepID=D7CIZ7_SYNLT|nr:EAL domain-containing protein [Syntrophothermus lipocalidus]ADI02875.1 diguanylate phosphodiesterase [Syntrophothermus lipocalidus DSM 12680]
MSHRLGMDDVFPFFQPVLAADTCDVWGYEVLGRVSTPHGPKSLGPFFHDPTVPAREKLEVDRLIREKALKVLMQAGPTRFTLLLNIQPQWLLPFLDNRERFLTLQYIESFRIDPEKIVIEISETEFSGDMEQLALLVDKYRQAGCRIAIDDVGCRLSNFDRIAALKPDILKVDTRLALASGYDQTAQNVLDILGFFAAKAGIDVVMEGVETAEVLRTGLKAGFRYYQGFLLGSPGPRPSICPNIRTLMRRELEQFADQETARRKSQFTVMERLETVVRMYSLSTTPSELESILIDAVYDLPVNCYRVYVCDRMGYQITPNFTRDDRGEWKVDTSYRRRNWAWRPYFYPTVTLCRYFGRGVVSDQYLDLESRRATQTACFPLKNDLFLFVDVDVTCQ